MTKIAVFGGSFDPPHIGHLQIIQKALERLDIERLFILPTFLNPFKTHSLFSPQKRLEWLEKIKTQEKSSKKITILDFEIKQNKATPTIKSINYIKQTYNPTHIYLLIGADNLAKLPLWDSYALLKNMVEFVIIARENFIIPENFKILECEKIFISSSEIRNLLAKKDKKALDFIPKILHDDFKL